MSTRLDVAPPHASSTPVLSSFNIPSALLKPDTDARSQLVTNYRLVHLLHHRNKNQHRRSVWYRHFDIFRRELKRLCLGLGMSLSLEPTPMASSYVRNDGKGSKKAKHFHAVPKRLSTRELTQRIVYWVESGLLERCYTAMTSLTTTPSFTPLALTLLAILARVCSLTGMTSTYQAIAKAHESRQAMLEENELAEVLARFTEETAGGLIDAFAVSENVLGIKSDEQRDIGTVISRGNVVPLSSVPQLTSTSTPKWGMGDGKADGQSKRRKKRANAIDDLFAELS